MWKNSELKKRANNVLSLFGFGTPFFVTIIAGFLMTDPSNLISVLVENPSYQSVLEDPEYAPVLLISLFSVLAFSILFNIFVGYPVLVGMDRFFMENRINGSKVERLFWAFKSGNYLNIVKIMFLMNLKTLLWSLLFIIPGIVKSYEYYMIPYILSENPGIDSDRAFEISKDMTDNEKFDIFWLGLSFIGWLFLGALACGIGILFVEPYIQATYAELYQVMREKAHSQNIAGFDELPGFFPKQP